MSSDFTMKPAIPHKPFWLILASVFCAAGVWLYADRVLIPHQISDAIAHSRPRGNLSDLYPQWLGARELLLHGRDPYSPEVTREIQQGYYSRPLDPTRPDEPEDQQGFAYPVYVTFYLAPTLHLPFDDVRKGFSWVLLGLTVATIPLWLRVLRWSAPLWAQASLIIFTIGSLTVMQGVKLPQMTLLVAALLAIGLALLASDCPITAGVALALATIKPQLVWLLFLWFAIWTLADWRRRYRWAASFLLAMTILFAASEWYLPHWIPRFVQALHRYQSYNDAVSILDKLLPSGWGLIPCAFAVAATLYIGWKNRRVSEDTPVFAAMACLTLAVTVIVTPSYALYNEVILLPAVLLLVRDRQVLWNQNRSSRVFLSLAAGLLLWQWLTSIVLAGLSFVQPLRTFEAAWPLPLWTVHFLAVAVAGLVLMMMMSDQRTFPTSPRPRSS
jgi:hypothetical protein